MSPFDRGARIVVTGASGFIGTNAVIWLRENTLASVLAIDIRPTNIGAIRECMPRTIDVRDTNSLRSALDDFCPTHILHLAARTDFAGNTLEDYSSNIAGVESLISAVRTLKVPPHVLFASSRYVHHPHRPALHTWDYEPTNMYAISKVIGESLVRSVEAFPWTLVRPTSIWGPHFGTPYRQFFELAASGRYVHAHGIRTLKTLGYVENTVSQMLQLLASHPAGPDRIFYLGDSHPVDIFEWARTIATIAGTRVITAPPAVLRCAASAGSLIQRVTRRTMPLTLERYNNLYQGQTFDVSATENMPNRAWIDLEVGTRRTLSWLGVVHA